MLTQRESGVLLHVTSLPSRFGIGDFGPAAESLLDWLAAAGQRWWQILPLVPTAAGDSPYQSPSAFAGNPALISPERLADDGWLTAEDLATADDPPVSPATRIDFPRAVAGKQRLLERAAERFLSGSTDQVHLQEFRAFVAAEADWLEPHAEFLTLRELNEGRWWREWTVAVDDGQRMTPAARAAHADRLDRHRLWQFWFFRQWDALRARAAARGIKLIGDVPIYVSHDSADVWANRRWFQLDEAGRSTFVAGVPPDYFSATGQLWMNPLYDWQALHDDGYRWWIARMRSALRQVDLVRLDHFRGFEAYWSVPAGETTAINGQWIPGPGDAFLNAIRAGLAAPDGNLPIIAEDLGMITEPVHALRLRFGLPGMKVLQFRLPGDPWEPPFRLDEFEPNSVVYTGTHDNDTTRGWFESEIAPRHDRVDQLRRTTPCDPHRIAWEFLEIAWRSTSLLAIAPLQDVLNLGHEARMNTPGTVGEEFGNWRWRLAPEQLTESSAQALRELTQACGRLPS